MRLFFKKTLSMIVILCICIYVFEPTQTAEKLRENSRDSMYDYIQNDTKLDYLFTTNDIQPLLDSGTTLKDAKRLMKIEKICEKLNLSGQKLDYVNHSFCLTPALNGSENISKDEEKFIITVFNYKQSFPQISNYDEDNILIKLVTNNTTRTVYKNGTTITHSTIIKESDHSENVYPKNNPF